MTDPQAWSIKLGRWAGTQVRVHPILWLYALLALLGAALTKDASPAQTGAWLLLLFVALAVHEIGHAAAAAWVGVEQEEIDLWPLGNLSSPIGPSSLGSRESLWIAAAGPAMSLLFSLMTCVGLWLVHAQQVFNPFGYWKTSGAPFLGDGSPARAFTAIWWVGWFGYINWVLFVANLIPALPLDNGRLLRGILGGAWGTPKDSAIGPGTAHVCAFFLALVGLIRLFFLSQRLGGMPLIALAIMIEIVARQEARMLEDGELFEEGLFGYDFSQGYTSLEAGSPKVRPYRESALKRWRRRRSEQRRLRREAQEAAEERRMDEILSKVHREGRSSLTDEEQRFLLRVSAKLRNRSRS